MLVPESGSPSDRTQDQENVGQHSLEVGQPRILVVVVSVVGVVGLSYYCNYAIVRNNNNINQKYDYYYYYYLLLLLPLQQNSVLLQRLLEGRRQQRWKSLEYPEVV